MTLSEKQSKFATMIGSFIVWVNAQSHVRVTLGEFYRPPELAAIYARQGRGIKNSLHTLRLAADLNLFVWESGRWRYVTSSAHPAWRPLGAKWEQMGGSWGGRFRDANHFGLQHRGIR